MNHWPLNGRWQRLSEASKNRRPALTTSHPLLAAISWMQQETDEGARQFPFCSDLTSFLCSLLTAYCKGKSWNTSEFPPVGSGLGQGRKSKFLRLVSFPLQLWSWFRASSWTFSLDMSLCGSALYYRQDKDLWQSEQCTLCNSYRKSWIHSWENYLHGTAYLINFLLFILLWLLSNSWVPKS